MSTSSIKFRSGIALGSLVGAGVMWLFATKKGKEVRTQVMDHAAAVYGRVKERILESESWDTLTKSKFAAVVQDAVDRYAIETGLADNIKRMVNTLVNTQWRHVKKEIKKRKKVI